MKNLYLFLNLGSFIVPFLVGFHPRLQFYKKWKSLFFSTLITTVIFIIWDIIFTDIGVWGFNPDYLLGFDIVNLPVEEWLFFICIPYACIFTYYSLYELYPNFNYSKKIFKILIFTFLILGVILAVYFYDRWYTFVNFSYFILVISVGCKYNSELLKKFLPIFVVILIPFFLVNGILTGSFIEEQVVWYNNDENLGLRMGTVPFEDIFYAFTMLFTNLFLLEYFENKKAIQ